MLSKIMSHFMDQDVIVTTSLRQAAQTAEGDFVEVTLVIDGRLMECTEDFILLGLPDGQLEAVNLRSVVTVRTSDGLLEEMPLAGERSH